MASIKKRADGKYRARYRDLDGREHAMHFTHRRDAELWLAEQVRSVARCQHVDPRAGRQLFGDFAEEWFARQVHRPSTSEALRRQLDRHVLPYLGHRPIGALRKAELQAWVRARSDELAPPTVKVVSTWVATILRAAVEDGVLATSPWRSIQTPKVERSPVVPLPVADVLTITARIVPHLRSAVLLGAATGLRQGELFGLTLDRIDFLARRVRIDRQLIAAPGIEPTFGPPKSTASYRTVPLPDVALEALAAHLATWPRDRHALVFQTAKGAPIIRNRAADAWRDAAGGLGLAPRTGWHALRHHYASVLIAGGESVKVVQSRLGHATAEETLATYAHLWPESEDRTRAVIDTAFGMVDGTEERIAD